MVNILCLFRYWRSALLDTENGSWPRWGTGYTKTPHRNLRGPSPYGWVSLSERTVCIVWTVVTLGNIWITVDWNYYELTRQRKSTWSVPRWLRISLRELQPPHSCCYRPTDYPNRSGRHKMADPLQFPPCRHVLDTNHNELAFPLPSGLRSNVFIIVSCSLCFWARGGPLLRRLCYMSFLPL